MNDKPQKPIERARAELDAVIAAEEIIRGALNALAKQTGKLIDMVCVDVLNHGELDIEIRLIDKQGE